MGDPVDDDLPTSRGRAASDTLAWVGGRALLASTSRSGWVRVDLPAESVELPASARLVDSGSAAVLPSVAVDRLVRRRLRARAHGVELEVQVVEEDRVGAYAADGSTLRGFVFQERGVWSGDVPIAEVADLTQELVPLPARAPRTVAEVREQLHLLGLPDPVVEPGEAVRHGSLVLSEPRGTGPSLSHAGPHSITFERRFGDEAELARHLWARLIAPGDDDVDPRVRLAELDAELAADGHVRGRDYVVLGLGPTPPMEEPVRIAHDGTGFDVFSVVDRGTRRPHLWTRSFREARAEVRRLLGRPGRSPYARSAPDAAVTFRGLHGTETFRRVGQVVNTQQVTVTTTDVRAATQDLGVLGVYAVVGRSGRATEGRPGRVEHPAGTRFRLVDVVRFDQLGVVLVAEQRGRWRRARLTDADRRRVAARIRDGLRGAGAGEAASGEFTGDIR